MIHHHLQHADDRDGAPAGDYSSSSSTISKAMLSNKNNNTNNNTNNNFMELPTEMKANIFSFLKTREIVNMGLVCSSLYEIVSPALSDDPKKTEILNAHDEYSIDIWNELIRQLKQKHGTTIFGSNKSSWRKKKKKEKNSTLNGDTVYSNVKECKINYMRLLLQSRICRICQKQVENMDDLMRGNFVRPCLCNGFVCKDPCLNVERINNESVSKCTRCGFSYRFLENDRHVPVVSKLYKVYPVSSQIVLTALSSLSAIFFIYCVISSFGYVFPKNTSSDVWLSLEDFWIFKHLYLWKYFVNGMSYISLVIFIIAVLVSLTGNGHAISTNDMDGFDVLGVIITILALFVIPYILSSVTRKHVTEKAVLEFPVLVKREDNDEDD